jgi:hypothetical protein
LQATPNYYFNARGDQEEYLISGNGSNTAGGGYYILMPNGNLYAWDGRSLATTLKATPVASLGVSYYQNPAQLVTPTWPGALSGITASINGTTLTINDTENYIGTVTVYVTVSDGALTAPQSFTVSFI